MVLRRNRKACRRLHGVDFVLDERRQGKKTFYLVRWSGFSKMHDSWTAYVTADVVRQWRRTKRARKWSKFLSAERIVRSRAFFGKREYLVVFSGSNEPEWTPFVSEGLLRAFS